MRLEEMIFFNYNKLNDTDLLIWKYITANKKHCSKMSINELVMKCNVSRATITRFVKKLDLKGFSEFKVLLSWESEKVHVIENQSFDIACNSIIKYVEDQKNKDYDALCKLLYESRTIYAYGSGDIQNVVAKQIKRMFLSCQEIIYDFEGRTFDDSFYNIVSKNDVMIIISLSGENENTLNIARRLKLIGTKIISITEFKNNTLTDLSDESIYISATNISFLQMHPSYKLTMLYFILIELLFIKYSIYKRHRMITEGIDCKL